MAPKPKLKLKVRPRKEQSIQPCAPQLMTMLGCWAVSHDLQNSGACAQAAKDLAECMKTSGGARKPPRSTINYHLGRLGKFL